MLVCDGHVLTAICVTWTIPVSVFFTSIIGWQHFVGRRTVQPRKCYVQYMDDAVFNCILQVSLRVNCFIHAGCARCGAALHLSII